MPETAQELGALLDRAGVDRYLSKSGRYDEALATENSEQLLYVALMEALGYSQNRGPSPHFLDLAGRVPYVALEGMCAGMEGPERVGAIEARLLSAVGLDHRARPTSPSIAWHLFRVRPPQSSHLQDRRVRAGPGTLPGPARRRSGGVVG